MINKILENTSASFEWIDVENPSIAEIQQIATEYGLLQAYVEDCLDPGHLPKFEDIGDSLFVVSRIYDPQSKYDADTFEEVSRKVSVFVSKSRLITIHRTPQEFIYELRDTILKSTAKESAMDGLIMIMNKVLLSYDEPARKLAEEIDFYESKIFLRSKIPDLLKSLYRIKRKASVTKRIIVLSKDILNRLEDRSKNIPLVRDLQDTYVMIYTTYDQIWEGIQNLMALYLSISSQKTNEVMRVLTIFSVFFMPLTFIVGIYGMNFRMMPELDWRYGYPFSIVMMLMVTVIIFVWFRRKKWL